MPDWLTGNAIAQWALYSVLLLLSARPVGSYLYRVFSGQRTVLHPVLRPVEAGVYRLTRVDEGEEMRWYIYILAILAFSIVGLLITYLIERTQQWQAASSTPRGFPTCRRRWPGTRPSASPPTRTGRTTGVRAP